MHIQDAQAAGASPNHAFELYSLEPAPQPITSQTQQTLRAEARQLHQLYEDLNKNFYNYKEFYVVSAKWFKRWQVYVSYQQAINDKPSSKFIGSGELPVLNDDIIDMNFKIDVAFEQPYHYLNLALVDGLKSEVDYILVNKPIWEILEKYKNIEILRKLIQTEDGRKVEVYFRKISAILLSNDILKDIEKQTLKKFKKINLQLPQYQQLHDLLPVISEKARDYTNVYTTMYKLVDFANENVRVWAVDDEMTQSKFKENLYKGCKINRSFSYKLHFPGNYIDLTGTPLSKLEFTSKTIIVFELKEKKQDWVFYNKQHPLYARCDFCKVPNLLNVFCSCMYGCYCSKDCKNKDKSQHKVRCERDAESSEQQKEQQITEFSKKGKMGLRNLGNTCFMNSGIQCITSIQQLTHYFFNGVFIPDINTSNPIGTKGQLSKAYGKLVRNMWCGPDSSVSPSILKRAIGKFQPMFVGYEQHDSGELISYLLDGLHEDLNKIKVKPYVQTQHHGGRPDPVLAKQGWQNFTKRNQSKIVQLLFGQYKSKLHCPNCQQQSITFDPFMTFPLPIPQSNKKSMQIIVMKNHIESYKMNITIEKGANFTLKNVTDDISKKLNISNNFIVSGGSHYSSEYIESNKEANQVRKDYKHKNIILRQLEPIENIQTDEKINVQHSLCHSQYGNQTYRRNITYQKVYLFNKSTTTKEMHLRFFSYYKSLLNNVNNYEQDIIKVSPADQKWRILIVTNSKFDSCYFCGQTGCENCPLPFDDNITLGDIMAKIKPSKYEYKLELEIYWRKDADAVEKAFQKVEKMDGGSNAAFGEDSISIYDCFKLAQQPETLDQDNEWYCPNCKDFVLAQKQLTLYKAPKIFIMYFKRFKGKGLKGLITSKLSSHIDFPVQGLDINQFLMDKSLPTEYNKADGYMQVQKDVKYDLFAISNHYGSLGGGHYTAYCKKGGEWFEYDDSTVTQVDASKIVTPAAYVLFYRKREQ